MSDPTRRAILTRLTEGPATVGELAEPFSMSLPAVSKHLKVLERAGLLEREIIGRVHHCRAVLEPLREAETWIAQREAFWDQGLDSLRSFLDESYKDQLGDDVPSTGQSAGRAPHDEEPTTERALAIVRRCPAGEWRIERFLDDSGKLPAMSRDERTRR